MSGVPAALQRPDLPPLELHRLGGSEAGDDLTLSGVLVTGEGGEPRRTTRVRVSESELRGVALQPGNAPGLTLSDVVLRDCDLSNVDGREGSIRRVEIRDSRLVGFGLTGGGIRDLNVVNSSLMLASFAASGLRTVVFDQVNLAEASFMQARLHDVEFVDCELRGADFRGAKLTCCKLRGSSLDGVLGVGSLSGLTMPWPDILASAASLATALGITIETD